MNWFWYAFRKPLMKETSKQEDCGLGTPPHLWSGFPLTSYMRCHWCQYYPYRHPILEITENLVKTPNYKPYGWMGK